MISPENVLQKKAKTSHAPNRQDDMCNLLSPMPCNRTGAFRRTRTRRKVERDDVQRSSRIDSLLQRLHDDRMVTETCPDRAPCRRLLALTGHIFSPAKTGGERRRGTGKGVHDELERMTAARRTLPLARR